ncbi:beta-1,3-galactosyltransferase pvg3-like [Aristolochia californica]|uniref:beta-1,3-galactosyltransferase pvg3-like n=1 Tax=Aristolochia californica TaxID=171875 RepID=UPI0035E1272C
MAMASVIANRGSRSSFSFKMLHLVSLLVFLSLLCLFSSMHETSHQTLKKLDHATVFNHTASMFHASCQIPAAAENPSPPPPAFRLFIGVLTQADQYWRRNILRLAYGTQSPPVDVQVDVKFVFCNLDKEDQRVLIALEIMQFDDIIILNCTENMDSGKTYTYFSSLPDLFNGTNGSDKPYDYVMKADDDTYFRLNQLVQSLMPLAREDLYYGFTIPCRETNPFNHYMSGMGYLLSWDLVEWIRTSYIPKNQTEGPEDKLVGDWLQMGGRGKNRYNTKPAMFDYAVNGAPDKCQGPFTLDTIGVHRLKSPDKWVDTFRRFDVTKQLKPSRLYYIA